MIQGEINFYSEDIDFKLDQPELISKWINSAVKEEGKSVFSISFVFCSDTYLHELNVQYLQHDTLTDVITFPYQDNPIEGDIYISIDRITDNATQFDVSILDELSRIMIHGILHLMGYSDKTPEEKEIMTKMENKYLTLLPLNT